MEMVMVLLLLLLVMVLLLLLVMVLLRLRLWLRLYWRMHGTLHAGLRVRGQEGLSRRLQELLPRGDEGPRGGRARLVEVQDPHRALGLHAGPHRPLPGIHGLLSLLVKGGPGRAERHRALRRNGMGTVKKRGRRWRWGASLLKQGVTWEPRICYEERISVLRRRRREWWRWWGWPSPLVLDWQPWSL